jgi:putative ABC transport system permease protein
LTACTNIANLFLARLNSRSVEFATRVALGASRWRIICQALTETTVLALAGGLVGAAIAAFGTELLSGFGTGEMRLLSAPALNLPAFLFAIGASLLTGIACGIVPAWRAPGFPGATRTTTARSGPALIVIEVALGTALLASAGLLLHSFVNVMRADRGYQIERVLSVDLSLFGNRKTTFYRDVSESLRGIPGVLAAGAITDSPATAASTGASRTIFYPTDTDFQRDVLSRPVAMIRGTTAGYFSASGTALRAGRYLEPQ